MKTVLGIFARDVKALLRNPIALLVVGALMILPGLYAWYCIVANWDPYSNTGNVPVAVVNEDEGASSNLTGDVNIGEQVVDALSGNESIDWRFYDDADEALQATADLECYATLVLPETLSSDIVGIFEGSAARPTVYYYPNEKRNAVATKVTDSAAQTLIRQVNQKFAATVNETLLSTVQETTDAMEERADKVNKSAVAEIRGAKGEIDKVIASLEDAESSIGGWRSSLAGAQVALTGTAEQLPAIRTALSEGSGSLNSLRTKTVEFDASFSRALSQSGVLLSGLAARAASSTGTASADVSGVRGALDGVAAELQAIADGILDDPDLKELKDQVDAVIARLETAAGNIDDAVARADGTVSNMNADVQDTVARAEAASREFSTSVVPRLSSGTYDLGYALSGLSGAIAQFEPQVSELKSVLSQADDALVDATDAIAQAKTLLKSVGDNLEATITDMAALGSAMQVDEIADLLNVDPENLGQFVSSPANMVTEKIYPVSNYGTAVAPFYTNLALWIGCFILLSLMKVEVNSAGFEDATPTQRYFGRLLLFTVLALVQSQVICGVDILLGIDCANPGMFMLAGAVCSFAYMNLLFALVITFRNIGRTLCILLLILQVPGSSGMYPIEMMPNFFQAIHPALPFTYGIGAMREALSGMYGTTYAGDLCLALAVLPVALIVGLALRPLLMNLLYMFDEELEKTGFFSAEEHGQAGDPERVVGMMRALASHESYRDDIEARAWSFNRRYPRLRRVGSIATFAIPFAVLAIALPFNILGNVSVNAKINIILALVVLLLAVQVALVVLEYAHRVVEEETRAIGASILGDEFAEYLTVADQVDEARRAAEEQADRANDEAATELLSAAPPISPEVLALISAEESRIGQAGQAPKAKAGRGKHAALPATAKSAARAERRRRRREGVVRDIFFTDMRLGLQSVIGVVVTVLLVITPSLYAWLNIAGSWDPYSKTDGLKVAVYNGDEGYKGELIPVRINVGDTIVSQLRGNHSFNWQFVDEDEALEGVRDGSYYAAITIPGDFSHNMMTYLTEDADYPDVTYYTNEKENPIAPIITQKGADSIQESIRTTFTERVDEVGLSLASDLVGYISSPQLSGYAQKMGAHLDDATHDMGSGATELRTLSGLSGIVSNVVATAGTAMDGVMSAAATAKEALSSAESGVSSASTAFGEAGEIVEDALSGSEGGIDRVAAQVDSALATLEQGAAGAPDVLAGAAQSLANWADVIQQLADDATDEDEKRTLQSLADSFSTLGAHVATAGADAGNLPGNIAATRAELKQLAADADDSIAEARSFYADVKGSADDLKSLMGSASSSTHSIMEGLGGTVEGLSSSTGGLKSQFQTLSDGLLVGGDKLETAARTVADAKDRLAEALTSGNMQQVQEVLLGADVETMAQRLAAPIAQERDALYPVSNYGSAMAPFYTVLSLWVGALVMISTMNAHLSEEREEDLRRRFAKVRPRHLVIGRYGIFGMIGLLQSALVLLGDLCLLHVQCAHPSLFLLFGLFIGQVFCFVVYTLTELFGDVGKAVCVILLIMQVAASGGTFPVQMMSDLFGSIAPFLPFYHGMTLLQECVAGVSVATAGSCIAYLLLVVGVAVLVGIVVRKPFRKLNIWFEAQLEKTGYM